MKPSPKSAELFLLLLLSFLWGGSFTLIKIAVETIPPATITAVRVAVAAVILLIISRNAKGQQDLETLGWKPFIIQGILQSALPFTLIAWGEKHIDSGLAGLLNATPPVFVFIFLIPTLLGTAGALRKGAGVIIGLLGVSLTIGLEGFESGLRAIAALAVTGASISYAVAAIYARRFEGISPIVIAGRSMAMAAVFVTPASFVFDRPWTLQPDLAAIISLIILSFVSTAYAMVLFFRLLQTLGPLATSTGSYLRAGFGVLLGIVVLGEPITWALVAGGFLIIVGVILTIQD